MSMDISSNRLLWIFSTLAIAFIVFIGFKSSFKNHSKEATKLSNVPGVGQDPAADTPADTIRALTKQVRSLQQSTELTRKDSQALLQQKNDLREEITNQVRQEMQNNNQTQSNNVIDTVMRRMDEFEQRHSQQPQGSKASDTGYNINQALLGQSDTFTVEPLNQGMFKSLGDKASALKDKAGNTINGATDGSGSLLNGLDRNSALQSHGLGQGAVLQANLPEPVYTVPRNSTLVASTGMTALVGRIPFKGKVDDPYPFKVIVGSDNLAANGLDIPGIDGMIFTGEAIGDWALGCVRGNIHSVTFVFEDGTIRTLSSDDQSLQLKTQQSQLASGDQSNNQTGNNQRPLGWLSDRRGIPCVTGQRITNAPQYLGGRFFARAVGAAGEAYARSQTTVQTGPGFGGFGTSSAVTGNPTKYALGETAAGASDELAQWIAERQAQNFDAVFVDTGAEVAVHVDQELPIDFEPKGRKLAYARKKRHSQNFHHAKLD